MRAGVWQCRRWFYWIILLCVAGGLSACATWTPPVAERVYVGRFALTVLDQDVHGEPQSARQSGRFTLSVNGQTTTLDLASPLGTTLARLQASPQGARLQVSEGGQLREVRDHDAQALSQNILGYPLPLTGLRWWIQGQPAPDGAARTDIKEGRLALIEQDGWIIRIEKWFDQPQAPRLIQLFRPASAGSPDIKLRVVLDQPATDSM